MQYIKNFIIHISKVVKKIYVFCQIEHNEYEIISFRIIIPNNNDISIIMKELRETIDNFEKTIRKNNWHIE
jgi:hypothetical protein